MFALDLLILAIGGIALRNEIVLGLGVGGWTRPVMWASYITNFVFWVGIAHCGTLVSAILFLFRSHFRRAVYRVAEAMTVFGVLTAGLFPLVHHRPAVVRLLAGCRIPNQRQIWPNFRSPLEWDVFAVTTYLTVSTHASSSLASSPTPRRRAIARRRVWRKLLSPSSRSAGAAGTTNWKHYYGAYLFFAAIATPLVLSVHSVVSWDFAMAQNPGWHSTHLRAVLRRRRDLLGRGAGHQPADPVIRKAFKLEHIVTVDHIEKLLKLVLLTSTIVGYSYLVEFFCAWYGPEQVRA